MLGIFYCDASNSPILYINHTKGYFIYNPECEFCTFSWEDGELMYGPKELTKWYE